MKKAKALIECFSFNQKRKAEKMITLSRNLVITYDFDIKSLKTKDHRETLATINKYGLIHIQQMNLTPYRIRKIKQFIKMYKPIGFYNQTSERIYKEYFI